MNLGQVFTPNNIVLEMIDLIQNRGQVLEPSCGDGAFLKHLPQAIGIEIDTQYFGPNIFNMDFFDYNPDIQFQTIIGNPPYVRNKEISISTKNKLKNYFDNRTNLYVHFIDKCIDLLTDHGELIFIVPRDFIKSTSAKVLNNRLMKEGTFTYWRELGDEKVFYKATPNVVIMRWEKNNFSNPLNLSLHEGQIFLTTNIQNKLSDVFTIHVGGASGANNIFIHEQGNIALVTSKTFATQKTSRAFYYEASITDQEGYEYLSQFKDELINRKIKSFTEKNWFEWGRKINLYSGPRIYVNTKTRESKPFYISDDVYFDGSVLALIPKNQQEDLNLWVNKLNNLDWESLGFKVGGRLIFSQNSLFNLMF
jgi:adenine-specific DNA-methyltransferase